MQTNILIGLFLCHFLCDYTPLSTPWMLRAKEVGKPLFPIFTHALVHATFMTLLLIFFLGPTNPKILPLFLFQLGTHFIIDILKGRLNIWFPVVQSPKTPRYWVVFGLDQYLHGLVIIAMSHYAIQ
jgi:hypothetical protein